MARLCLSESTSPSSTSHSRIPTYTAPSGFIARPFRPHPTPRIRDAGTGRRRHGNAPARGKRAGAPGRRTVTGTPDRDLRARLLPHLEGLDGVLDLDVVP